MTAVFLQPSMARDFLESTIDFRRQNHKVLHPVDYQLAVRARFLGVAVTGVVQAIHCFSIWVIMSLAALLTLGRSEHLNEIADRAGSLSAAGFIAVAVAVGSIFNMRAAEILLAKFTKQADRRFDELCEQFTTGFDQEAEELRKVRHARATSRKEKIRREIFDREVKAMRSARRVLYKQCTYSYPSEATAKYDALCQSRALMYEMHRKQQHDLPLIPYTQLEVDGEFVQKTLDKADEAMQEVYAYPKKIWSERIVAWGDKWDRESFAEQSLKLFKKQRVDSEVESLVGHVKEAEGKERAYNRFTKDINGLVRKVKGQIDKAEYPSVFKRAWWKIQPWLQPSS